MVLVKFVAFVVVEILCSLVFMQITADVGRISKTVQGDLMFIFDELSEFFRYLCVKYSLNILGCKKYC